jgi:hypothetical protein
LVSVAGLQAQEVEQDVQVLAVVGLRRRGVVVLVLLVVLDHGLERDGDAPHGVVAADRPAQVVEQPHRLERVGVVAQVVEVGADAAVQDAAQVRQRQEARVEQVAAVALHERLERPPLRLARQRL